MPTIQIASSNAGKIAEFRLALRRWQEREAARPVGPKGHRLALTIEPVAGIGALPECVEDGETFSANAQKKAVHYSNQVPGVILADDSGLEVDALGGAPGVRSRRYSGPNATDAENNFNLLRQLEGMPAAKRGAQFVCVLALARAGKIIAEFRGVARGILLDAQRGEHGFGYDPLFVDLQTGKTFAEFSPDEKLERSHRGRAVREMFDWLAARPDALGSDGV